MLSAGLVYPDRAKNSQLLHVISWLLWTPSICRTNSDRSIQQSLQFSFNRLPTIVCTDKASALASQPWPWRSNRSDPTVSIAANWTEKIVFILVNDAFVLTKSSALISLGYPTTGSSVQDSPESFVLPPTSLTYSISVVGSGDVNDSLAVMCLPQPHFNQQQTAQLVKRHVKRKEMSTFNQAFFSFNGSENGSTTLCARPVIAAQRDKGSTSVVGFVANYFACKMPH